jgi:hypothetical protein
MVQKQAVKTVQQKKWASAHLFKTPSQMKVPGIVAQNFY